MSETLTPARIEEMDARCNAATKGPWQWYNGCSWWRLGTDTEHDAVMCPRVDHDGHPNMDCSQQDRDFVEHARTDLPAALAEVKRLRSILTLCTEKDFRACASSAFEVQDAVRLIAWHGLDGRTVEEIAALEARDAE